MLLLEIVKIDHNMNGKIKMERIVNGLVKVILERRSEESVKRKNQIVEERKSCIFVLKHVLRLEKVHVHDNHKIIDAIEGQILE